MDDWGSLIGGLYDSARSGLSDFSNWAGSFFGNQGTNDYLNSFMNRAGGDPYQANVFAETERLAPGMENFPDLRNASHALTGTNVINQTYGVAAPFLPAVAGAYSGAKWLAQNAPGGQVLDQISPTPLYGASPPSWAEYYYGGIQPVLNMFQNWR